MTRVLNWLRIVLHPDRLVTGSLFIYLAFELIYLLFQIKYGRETGAFIFFLRDPYASIWVALWGVCRVVAYHPFFLRDYREWLQRTPWRASRPLPIGPIGFAPQDVVVLLIVRGLLHGYTRHEALLPLVYVAAVSLTAALTCWLCGVRPLAYVIAFGVGAAVLISYQSPWLGLALMGLAGLIAWAAIQRSLQSFPWTDQVDHLRVLTQSFSAAALRSDSLPVSEIDAPRLAAKLGWPFNLLHPRRTISFTTRWDHVWICLLIGWVFFVIKRNPHATGTMPATLPGIPLIALCVVSLVLYAPFRPPISFFGRFATGRLIIPNYDRVFIAPLLSLLIFMIGGVAINALFHGQTLGDRILHDALSAATLTGMFLAFALVGPSRESFRLTGEHRIVYGSFQSNELTPTG